MRPGRAPDPTGEHCTFERGATKTGGGEGWADVWKKGHFSWEYKGKHKDLTAAFARLTRSLPLASVTNSLETSCCKAKWRGGWS